MFDDVIKIYPRRKDLDRTDEFWQADTFENRWNTILANIVKITGFSPSNNMEPVREGVFRVKEDTSIEELQALSRHVRSLYGIECFQIAIERPGNTAHMLFDFNIRDEARSVVINRSQKIALSVLILRFLKLPRPEGAEDWLSYFLKDKFQDDPDVFDALLSKIKHAKLGKESYALARDMIVYVQKMCTG